MEKISQILSLQDDRFEQIKKSAASFGDTRKFSLAYFDTRLENLEKIWQSFKTAHDQLVAHVSREQRSALDYFDDDVYSKCEEEYFVYKSTLKTKIREMTPEVKSEPQPTENKINAEIKLPTITIPTFSGKYTDWTTFHDLFTSLIYNSATLDNVQKLHYLKSCVSGEAETLLKSISVTDKNYEQAWNTLKNRYNNKRYISNCIFKRLFGIRTITTESAVLIKQLLDITMECLNSLKNMGLPTDKWDALIVYLTISKLDMESQKQWETHLSFMEISDFPSFEAMKQFLETRFRSLEMVEYLNKSAKPKTFHASLDSGTLCAFCSKEDHFIYQCKEFGKISYKSRLEFVQKKNLCFNCLIPNHSSSKCLRDTSCRICKKKHHSLLHRPNSLQEEERQRDPKLVSHFVNNEPGQILLATALVDTSSRQGMTHVYRALIDQGSQASFVTEDLVQTLGLKRVKINGTISGLSEGNTLHTKYMVQVSLRSRRKQNNFTIQITAYVLKKITSYLPAQQVSVYNWPELENLELADPNYDTPAKIHLLLGADVYAKIIDNGLLKSPAGIIAQQTQLGWILSGDTRNTIPGKEKGVISMHLHFCESEIIKRFWEIENEVSHFERVLTKEEKRAEEIYNDTTVRTDTGRYKVNLPFIEECKTPVEKCGKTKEIATLRFLQLENKFKKDKLLKEEYTKVIHEYEELGHMKLVTDEKDDAIYLPHHAVVKYDRDTTKVRTVFDASSKGSKGYSLNDTLLIGPVIQKDLRTLIMEWRQHKIAIVSDIVKMYRQILVQESHTDYQRILWRDDPHQDLKIYKLLTVTFGTAAAPFLAVRTLKQVAEDEKHNYPLGANIVKTSFYMDDLMTGAPTEEEAIKIYQQVNELLKSAGFELQKWSSNSDNLLEKIKENREGIQHYEIKFDQIIKTLGLHWDRIDDKFKFSYNLPKGNSTFTKRGVLAEVARLFDPFGWLAPTIVKAKILIQKLWLCTAGWDEPLPSNLEEEWISFRTQLPKLQNITVNRWIYTHPNIESLEIHGFADASTAAYAAVLYVRVVENGRVRVSMLESKTKVAPLKQISIARLELCAAVLLAKLIDDAANVLKVPKDKIYAYTDSMVALAWIEGHPYRWQTFVANRVTEIQNRLENDKWSHIISEENPADIASRGLDPDKLEQNKLWWNGPEWLQDKNLIQKKKPIPETNLERRKQQTQVFLVEKEEDKPIWERFSNLNHMIRVLTYCRRFLNLKNKNKLINEVPTYLTSEEMKNTLDICIKQIQKMEFEEEINDLKEKRKIKCKSKLRTLSPYIDNNGILRVGGRLQAANLPEEIKHPIIIPKNTHLTTLIVRDAHIRLLHGGMALTMNYLRSRYWVIGLKPIVKKCFRECVVCTRYKAATIQPQMGELPESRVNPGRAFETCGVDFAGPIQMRVSKGRGQRAYKGYICLFVCMKTRAVHLEAVSDLTSQGFIAAFRRFVSRRGHCSHIWSDNGLNFVGAAKELTQMLNHSMSEVMKEIAEMLNNDGTTWHFIPPKAPNFGGLWEAGVKSVKTHIVKTIGDSTLTYEEMATLLSQVEACLNSRPIGQLTDHPDDLAPLTPGHFLIGEALRSILDRGDLSGHVSPLHRWRLTQRMVAQFWKRWSKEYLHTMQQRYKWQSKSKAPKIGDVVIIKEDDVPPTKWLLAKITEIHFGPDKEVRVVSLKTKSSILKRPLSKIICLPREE